MKNKLSFFIASFLLMTSTSAFAKKLNCDILGASTSLEEQGQEILADELTVSIDTVKGTAKLSSSNGLYGANPFLVMTEASEKIQQKYQPGVLVYTGKNPQESNQLYVLAVDEENKQGSFEVFSKNQHIVADVKCK